MFDEEALLREDFFWGVGLLDELDDPESDEDESESELLESSDDELDPEDESSLELLDVLVDEYFRLRLFRLFVEDDFLLERSSSELSSSLLDFFFREEDDGFDFYKIYIEIKE